ncbi:2Fe-2S iron-sulfur cluster-binding protein [uncultured Abyssibacter sp.]|uniref:2Fe-2S iron-sulfur cluster-binding protein n=1 Tax=uncultured Abyssibacter sp. TaxID=2320202 RepID=UPI0032B1D385
MKINVTDRAGNALVLDCEEGDRLMDVLAELDLVEATCGGECSCATCQVYVDPGWLARLPAREELEVELLDELLNSNAQSRLACQINLESEMDGLTVTIASAE